VGSANPDVVAVEARKAAHARGVTATLPAPAALGQQLPALPPGRDRVVSLTERRLVDARDRAGTSLELPADGRPLLSVAQYDELLTHPPAAGNGGA